MDPTHVPGLRPATLDDVIDGRASSDDFVRENSPSARDQHLARFERWVERVKLAVEGQSLLDVLEKVDAEQRANAKPITGGLIHDKHYGGSE